MAMTADGTEKVEYFYNTRTQMVERGRQSPWEHLMGPYESFADATQALETAKKRNQEWRDDDEAWDGEDS